MNVIVAFSRAEDAKNIKNILTRNGFLVAAVCTSGAQAISSADELGEGILICGSRFKDMVYQEIYECLPKGVKLLLVASPVRWGGQAPDGIMCLSLPLKVGDLVSTLEMMLQPGRRKRRKPGEQRGELTKERSSGEQEVIWKAKELLMERNRMTEAEAHRYIQKCSMDSGTNMVETAEMIMSLIRM